ncbi:exodeoxyribonuclease VII small subunit [Clostridium sp. MB40-C1]|uniref:exodeoxyribonuclease VII small subunit n=1 Tax=Clostridium sp. MB40-C1 TaxID=3070996 RepID=UPI0027DFE77F|nr:exodeoxyribonuclease VII small subunit [Clostridium sp. MB40-C1]WMJ81863.1 exodeoxyribonuclease VII small subunit [Clostridium sp. MB40-C1]
MPKKKESYETLIEKVESIIETMEKEEISLENSIKNYEEGINICNKLYKILNEAEGKIKIVTDQGEKEFIKVDE